MKLEDQIIEQSVSHEAEVKLRLKFEGKLNTMHAVHRQLDAKYRDWIKQIDSLKKDNNLLKTGYSEQTNNLNELKVEKVDLNTKVDSNTEKIQLLTNDILAKNNFIEDMTEKLQENIRDRDNTKYKLDCANKDIDKLKSHIDLLEGKN